MMTQKQYEKEKENLKNQYAQSINRVKNDVMAPQTVIDEKVKGFEEALKEELSKLEEKFKKEKENENSLQKAVEKVKKNTLGQGSVETWKNIADSNNGDGDIVAEKEQNTVDRRTAATESYDNKTLEAKNKEQVKKAQKVATTINADANADYDIFPSWEKYYNNLKKIGLTDEQIKVKLKGSKWDKEGSKFREWRDRKKQEKQPTQTESVETTQPTQTEVITPEVNVELNSMTEEDEKNNKKNDKKNLTSPSSSEERNKEKIDKLSRQNKLSEYLNSNYPNTFGLIFGDSGLNFGQRLAVGLSALGSLTGDVLLANGKSLLGDNSLFEKIGSKLGIDNFTTENQKKFSKDMNDSIIETAKQTTQNKALLDKLYSTQNVKIDEKQMDYLSFFSTVIGSMSEDEAIKELERNGFSKDDAKIAYNNCIQVSKTTASSQTLSKGANEVDSSKLNLFNQKFDSKEKINSAIRQLQKQRDDLQKRLVEISQMDFEQTIKFAKANREVLAGVSSMASNQSDSSSNSSGSSWNVGGSVQIPVIPISVSGGYNSTNSLSTSSAKALSQTMDYLALSGINTGKSEAKKWWNQYGKDLKDGMKIGVENAIKDIDSQIVDYKEQAKNLNGSSDENLKNYVELNDEERSIWKALTNLEEMEFLSTSKDFDELYYKLTH